MLSNLIAMGYFLGFLYHIRKNTVITPNPKAFSTKQHIPGELLGVGLPGFVMTMMSTISNAALNLMVAGYSDTAIAGMGDAHCRLDRVRDLRGAHRAAAAASKS